MIKDNATYNIALNHAILVINKRLKDMPKELEASLFAALVLHQVKEDIKSLKRVKNESI